MSIQVSNSEENQNPELLNECLKYAGLSWKIFPCHGITDEGKCTSGVSISESTSPGKRPATTNGLKDATSDPETIKRWWHTQPLYNIGVNCKASGFIVIDIDPRNGGDESFEKFLILLGGELPETVEALTGKHTIGDNEVRGRHLYFAYSSEDKLIGDLSKFGLDGIDIKHNGYVIVPPSRHASGLDYEWAEGAEPWNRTMAQAPSFLINKLIKTSEELKVEKSDALLKLLPIKPSDALVIKARIELNRACDAVKHLKIGRRNKGLNSIAFEIGGLVGIGHLEISEVVTKLTEAARFVFPGVDGETEILTILRLEGGALEAGAIKKFEASLPPKIVEDEVVTESTLNPDEDFLKMLNKIDWTELWADTSVEKWLIEGIICEGRSHTWYSKPGIGKSLMIREACACLASGRSVFGLKALEPMSVLYIDHENDPKGDIKRSLIDMGFKAEDLDNFHLLSFPEFAPFDLGQGGLELMRAVDLYKPRLVVMDTASRTVDGKENDNDTWIAFYRYTGKLLKKRKIAYIRIDHTGKDLTAGPRGGSAKMGDMDMVWHLKEFKSEKSFRLVNDKHRIPILKKEFIIERHLAPLRHSMCDPSPPWLELLAIVDKSESTLALIETFLEENPSHPTGLKNLYSALLKECKSMKISRRDFDKARKEILADRENSE